MTQQASTVEGLVVAMGEIAPLRLAQSWDNVGLLAGSASTTLSRLLLCIDTTDAVVSEAARIGAQAIVSYHPPIFRPIKRLAGPETKALAAAVRHGIAIYSPHTALDAADGGTGDAIAGLLGATLEGPLQHDTDGAAKEVKVTVFTPPRNLASVAEAMFAEGAGRIGLYEKCSFRSPGQGTFFGTEGTDPAVGRRGRMEYLDEIRLETVCPVSKLAEVIQAMRSAHPYEEPAFDVYVLAAKPGEKGIGRMARLPKPETLGRLARRLADATAAQSVQIVGDARRRVRRVAILVGSAGRVHEEYPSSKQADALITGEIRHHDAIDMLRQGGAAIALGHWTSERPVLPPLRAALRKRLPDVDVRISRADRDPFAGV